MRTLLVFEVDIDEGSRPSTRARRIDGVVRTVGAFVDRLRSVRSVRSVSVFPPEALESLVPEIRFDGSYLDTPRVTGIEVGE